MNQQIMTNEEAVARRLMCEREYDCVVTTSTTWVTVGSFVVEGELHDLCAVAKYEGFYVGDLRLWNPKDCKELCLEDITYGNVQTIIAMCCEPVIFSHPTVLEIQMRVVTQGKLSLYTLAHGVGSARKIMTFWDEEQSL